MSRLVAVIFNTVSLTGRWLMGARRRMFGRLLRNHSLLPLSYLARIGAGEKVEEGSHLSCRVLRPVKMEGHLTHLSQHPATVALPFFAVAILCAAFAGCTDASITRANHETASGNYATAHEYFAIEATKSAQLSPRERRQVMDGLCLTEYQMGAPTYPLIRQLHTCAAALNEPGSESGRTFANVARKERESLAKTINSELAQQDIARADDAILRYRATAGSNPELAGGWTRQLWTIVNREAAPANVSLTPTIGQLSRQFRHQQKMNDHQFRRWIEESMTVGGSLMVSNVEIGKHTVDLWLGADQLANAALNLDRFARVNDGLVARCHCDGRTKVALQDSGLPAYLVRLDTASHQSEVLILDQP